MPWIKRSLRGTEVFARTREDGSLDVGADGRVEVKYQPGDAAKVYRAAERNLVPISDRADERPLPRPAAEPIVVYTDGACAGNPGPMGIGVVITWGKERREIGEYIGVGTNNVAELTAIERALEAIPPADRSRLVLLHADSSYALGVVSGTMKAKKNVELVARIRGKAKTFSRLEYVKVRGHAGVAENERCDALATGAIEAARKSGRA
jgi:ribonuclease HI